MYSRDKKQQREPMRAPLVDPQRVDKPYTQHSGEQSRPGHSWFLKETVILKIFTLFMIFQIRNLMSTSEQWISGILMISWGRIDLGSVHLIPKTWEPQTVGLILRRWVESFVYSNLLFDTWFFEESIELLNSLSKTDITCTNVATWKQHISTGGWAGDKTICLRV
jgi:hypothetical protein